VKLCDLTLTLGDARSGIRELRHILDNEAPRALALAEAIEDSHRACRACMLAQHALADLGGIPAVATTEGRTWVKTLDQYAPSESAERAWANEAIGTIKFADGDMDSAIRLIQNGVSLARKLGDIDAFVINAAMFLFFCPSTSTYVEEGRRLAEELIQVWDKSSLRIRPRAITYTASIFLALGGRERAERLMREFAELGRRTNPLYFTPLSTLAETSFQLMDGQLEEATKTMLSIVRGDEEMGLPGRAGVIAGFSNYRLSGYLGRGVEGLRALDRWTRMTGFRIAPVERVYFLAHAGRQQEAAAILDEVIDRYAASSERVKGWFPQEILLLEAAVLAHHARAAEVLLAQLADTPFKTTGFLYPTCIPPPPRWGSGSPR
jgi:hypothetical protein